MSEPNVDLIEFCRGLFNASNLTAPDIADASAERVEHDFAHDSTGVRVSFSVSDHCVGKTHTETQEALHRLLARSS